MILQRSIIIKLLCINALGYLNIMASGFFPPSTRLAAAATPHHVQEFSFETRRVVIIINDDENSTPRSDKATQPQSYRSQYYLKEEPQPFCCCQASPESNFLETIFCCPCLCVLLYCANDILLP